MPILTSLDIFITIPTTLDHVGLTSFSVCSQATTIQIADHLTEDKFSQESYKECMRNIKEKFDFVLGTSKVIWRAGNKDSYRLSISLIDTFLAASNTKRINDVRSGHFKLQYNAYTRESKTQPRKKYNSSFWRYKTFKETAYFGGERLSLDACTKRCFCTRC